MTEPYFVRREARELEPYSAGLSIDEIREKYGLERIIKMGSNEHPLGVSPLARRAVERAAGAVFRYPQSGNPGLVRAIAQRHKVSPESVLIGNGSGELIDLMVRCLAEPGRHNAVLFKPCFSLYPIHSRLAGIETRQAPLRPDFSFDWEALLALVDENTRLVFVTSPDNPSGYCPPARELEELARRLPPGVLLTLDEAYMDFAAYADGKEEADLAKYSLLPRLDDFPNVAVLRTFSKSYALAGLRLGYAIMPAEPASFLRRARLPFPVNILAEAAGLAALEDKTFRLAGLAAVAQGRAALSSGLAALGCRVYPSKANFIMFAPPPAPAPQAEQVFDSLLRRGLIIRRLHSYGLPDLLRVSVGNAEENSLFLQFMDEALTRTL